MKPRSWFLIAALVALIAALSGCGGRSQSSEPTAQSSASPSAATQVVIYQPPT